MATSDNHISTPLLLAKNLSIGYGNHILFSDLNVELKAGELVCLMGPNGIGKSTLIKTLIGLQAPLAGEIIFSEKRPIEKIASVVLTDRVQHPQLKVSELITLGRYPYLNWKLKLEEEDERQIQLAIEQTRIQHLIDKKITELSDGQMQMVMIARALAQQTRILLLDEPTAHLDLNNRLEIMNLLKRLTRETNRAILIATHELDLALQTADTVWIAGPDKKIKSGIPEDLVLDGSFDTVFQFKGYDLKTGKISHEEFRDKKVCVKGEGYALLWTKNALERSGYSVVEDGGVVIEIVLEGDRMRWMMGGEEFLNISLVLDALK
jgi:iron complex transport system ATP-binding protein